MNNQSIALVLGSGGAKGYAHIGVIKAIKEAGYSVSSVTGTSMGALVGGLYAAGKLTEAYEWFKSIDKLEIFRYADLKNISKTGLINGDYIFEKLYEFVGDVRIEDLPIPFCAVAADLDSGREKVFTSGRLLDAIRASISMPVFFVPYTIDGCRYIDGGVVNGLPINRVKRVRGDKVIAVNLDTFGDAASLQNELTSSILQEGLASMSSKTGIAGRMAFNALKLYNSVRSESFLTILLSSYDISLKQNKLAMVEQMKPDVYLNVDLHGYSTKNFSDAQKIAMLGYNQMKEQLNNLISNL